MSDAHELVACELQAKAMALIVQARAMEIQLGPGLATAVQSRLYRQSKILIQRSEAYSKASELLFLLANAPEGDTIHISTSPGGE